MDTIETNLSQDNVDISVELWDENEILDGNVIDAEEEIEMTIDEEEPTGSTAVNISPIKAPIQNSPPRTPPRTPTKELKLKLSELNNSPKMNISTATAETEAPSFDDEGNTPSSKAMDSSKAMGTSTSMMPNELFSDAFDQLTDLAVAAGILSKPSHGTSPGRNVDKNLDNMTTAFNGEEPGRIRSSATDDTPFDEASMDEASMDEAHIHEAPMDEAILGRKGSGEMSTIARMRYLKAMGISTPERKSLVMQATQSHEEIQKGKHDKWRNMKAQATQQEAMYMQIEQDRGDETFSAKSNSVSSYPKRGRRRNDSEVSEEDGAITGIFDLSILTKPLESAQAAIFEAFMGGDSDEDEDSCSSSHYDDGDGDDDSESCHSSRNESKRERKARRRKQKRSNANLATKDSPPRKKNEWNFEEPDDDFNSAFDSAEESEPMRVFEKTNQSGFNKSFLEDITGSGIELEWHRPRSNPALRLVFNVRINIQITDTGDGHIEPSLVWEVMEENHGRNRSKYQAPRRESISLFDIASIQRATDSLNLNAFPHAIPDHSVLITLADSSCFLFEAPDIENARKFMRGLRWIEARMTFNIIVGNMDVCSEMLITDGDEHSCIGDLTAEIFQKVTNELVDKAANY